MSNQGYAPPPHVKKTTTQKVLDKVFAAPIWLGKKVIGAVLLKGRPKE